MAGEQHGGTRWALRVVVATLAGAAVLSMIAPHLHARREERFLEVRVNVTEHAQSGGVVTVLVRGHNTHPSRRRVYASWVDVSESLGRAGSVMTATREPAHWVPIARSWRMPFDEEIAPGETRDIGLKIVGVKPGRYEGMVDVVLDGTSWVRSPVSFEVSEALPERP